MNTVLIESHYLPCIAYFSVLSQCETLIVERHENFVKQSYRNRYYINTSQGIDMMSVPLTGKHGKVAITEVKIEYAQRWQANQLRALKSAYGNAPFYEFYAEDLERVLSKNYVFLYDLNIELLSLCLKWLKMPIQIQESLSYTTDPVAGVIDLRNEINAKNVVGSNKYYKSAPYNQVFGNKFVNNLSLIDLIFCAGPQARQIVRDSVGSK